MDHRENIADIVSSCDDPTVKPEDISYYTMWQRSKAALENLQDFLSQILDLHLEETTMRQEIQFLKTFALLEGKETFYIDKMLKLR